jgi:hypothetical protein
MLHSLSWLAGGLVLLFSAVGAAGQNVPIVSVNPATQYTFNEQHGNGMVGWVFNSPAQRQVQAGAPKSKFLSGDHQISEHEPCPEMSEAALVDLPLVNSPSDCGTPPALSGQRARALLTK